MDVNKVILAGHLVRDPELKYTQNQTPLATFDIAINYKRGEREETCFINCTAFGKLSETIVKYFTKGKPIFVCGRLTQDRWEAEDGTKRSRIKVIVDEFKFVGSVGNSQTDANVEASKSIKNNEEDVFK